MSHPINPAANANEVASMEHIRALICAARLEQRRAGSRVKFIPDCDWSHVAFSRAAKPHSGKLGIFFLQCGQEILDRRTPCARRYYSGLVEKAVGVACDGNFNHDLLKEEKLVHYETPNALKRLRARFHDMASSFRNYRRLNHPEFLSSSSESASE
ncbi:hypothetical protein HN51_043755 [Arachis hypogaea]